jgi:hypothetical protein
MYAHDTYASMPTSRCRASGKTLKFSLSMGAKRAFSVRRCDSATGRRLRAALWVAFENYATMQARTVGDTIRLLSYFCNPCSYTRL